jgi:excisionase family DNA binding protein
MKIVYIAEKEELQTLIKECIHVEMESILKELNQKSLPERLNLQEAAEYLGVTKATMYGYTCARKLPYYKFGKRIFFYTKELEACLQKTSLRHKSMEDIEREASESIILEARKKLNRRR